MKRLRWYASMPAHNGSYTVNRGVELGYDRVYDMNPRLVSEALIDDHGNFAPFFDGIFSVGLQDQDDYPYIQAKLACSLTATCP